MSVSANRLLILYVSLFGAVAIGISSLDPLSVHPEDGLFYVQILHNIANGFGGTFHGITKTNGYHPLQVLINLPVYLAVQDKGAAAFLALTLQVALGGLCVAACLSLLRGRLEYWWIAAPFACVYFLTFSYGTEAQLQGVLYIALLYTIRRWFDGRSNRVLTAVGILAALCFLARLDNIFVSACLGAWLLSDRSPDTGSIEHFRRLFVYAGLPAFGIAFVYLGWNLHHTGHLVPISGAIKSSFPMFSDNMALTLNIHSGVSKLGVFGTVSFFFAVMGLFAGVYMRRGFITRLIIVQSTGVLLYIAYIFLFTRFGSEWSWYYVIGVINFTLVFSAVAERIIKKLHISRQAVLFFLFFTAVGCFAVGEYRLWNKVHSGGAYGLRALFRTQTGYRRWQIDAAEWLDRKLPENSRIFVCDYPGILAAITSMRIFPGDGLVNDFDYSEMLLREGIDSYLRKKDINYILCGCKAGYNHINMSIIEKSPGRLYLKVRDPLTWKPAGEVLLPENAILMKVLDISGDPFAYDFALWRIE